MEFKDDFRVYLRDDTIPWLLERDNPSVRYFTLRDLLERSEEDAEVIEAKSEIMKSGVVPRILKKQQEGGYWGKAEDFYVYAKYKGTTFQLIILAELGANGQDERVRKACEFMLENAQDRQGGFAVHRLAEGSGDPRVTIPCQTGNMVWSLIRLGYLHHPGVQQGIDWINRYQRFDDGLEKPPHVYPYNSERCWSKHTCFTGAIKGLKALAEIPPQLRTVETQSTIDRGVEFLLIHHIFKRSHNLLEVSKPEWLQFGFPWFGDDVLEILEILTRLGYHDERMQEAVELVISKQDKQGRWILEKTFNGRFWVNIEQKGMPSKWVTLNVLRVLKK